ncbi:serine/threonine-protein kinase [Streptomyces olivoreticuli]|uniref:serine/threonine-protein kinase n=1 Tax=Streptomyces olivoreticuli TaxID=68246 RepID=UPI000E24D578|nr:serine/threonine-protein kinase [Streptomyces olivoreticuli]
MQPLRAEDPQVIGAYRLLGRLGAGGMGLVYLGRSAGGRTVAVKVVHPHFALDEQFRARFRREVAAARRVAGDARPDGRQWTAPVLDADPDAAVPWVATGYVAGPSLTEAVLETGAQPEPTVRALGAGLAEALAAVHALGLVHRDVKPSNVLLSLDGPRLIDFGIARASDATAALTETGVSVGSPGYMAPEQILGAEVTAAADVFSYGAVLAYAATGEPPFPGDNSAGLLYRVVHEPPVLGPALTGELRLLIESCLAKSPADRPAPADLARRLAPGEGARGLVRSGWLPAPLLERVTRRAVELLDLEADGFSPTPTPTPTLAEPGEIPRLPSGLDAPHRGSGEPRPRHRRRTLALVTVALAATAAALVYLLPSNGNSKASSTKPATSATGGAAASSVPKEFLGTWTGDIRQSDGTPNGTVTAAVSGGGTGAYVVRTTYSALNVLECHSKAKLLSATTTELTLEEVSDGTPALGCTGNTSKITFTLTGGDRLAYASEDAAGGRPTATLTRSGQ